MPKMMKSFTIKALGETERKRRRSGGVQGGFQGSFLCGGKERESLRQLGRCHGKGLEDTAEFKEFWDKQERTSPMMLLADQNRGYNLQPEWTPPPRYQARPRGPISTSFTSLRMT